MHTTAARYLITQKHQEEYETLRREQARSLDYWLAKAQSYCNKRTMDIVEKEAMGNEMKMKMEEETMQSVEEQKHYYVIPEREREQIERHIHRTGQATGFKNRTFRQPQPLSETLPEAMPEKHGIQKTQRRKQVNEREQMQIKDHQEHMIRGRELSKDSRKESGEKATASHLHVKSVGEHRKASRSLRVTAYPLFQPCSRSRVQATALMEKPQTREEVDTILKPSERRRLALPPFWDIK
ncbi:hypothetical protein GW7_02939 [Heterocephalus glaber]|uniref:Uncharacterized protein n=1 Tax=Heterocephalus glaber TaxID=10181 RepID=G5BAN9_HETGA|nr:hypothetical protein GW7_02939 [Heterocephalus glaber]